MTATTTKTRMTEEQQKVLATFQDDKPDRILQYYMAGEQLVIEYKTKSDYVVRARFLANGSRYAAEYYLHYDHVTMQPFGHLFSRLV